MPLSIVQKEEMRRAAAKLRQIATELRELAPTVSTRASALASDVDTRLCVAERQAVAP